MDNDQRLAIQGELLHSMKSFSEKMRPLFQKLNLGNREIEIRLILSLFLDTYLSIHAFCQCMIQGDYSQAFALLRLLIEQASSCLILAQYKDKGAIEEFFRFYQKRVEHSKLEKQDEKAFKKKYNISQDIPSYLDYGWAQIIDVEKTGGKLKEAFFRLAGTSEYALDISETLNSFAHGGISVFNFPDVNTIQRYNGRAISICADLFIRMGKAGHQFFGLNFDNLFDKAEYKRLICLEYENRLQAEKSYYLQETDYLSKAAEKAKSFVSVADYLLIELQDPSSRVLFDEHFRLACEYYSLALELALQARYYARNETYDLGRSFDFLISSENMDLLCKEYGLKGINLSLDRLIGIHEEVYKKHSFDIGHPLLQTESMYLRGIVALVNVLLPKE